MRLLVSSLIACSKGESGALIEDRYGPSDPHEDTDTDTVYDTGPVVCSSEPARVCDGPAFCGAEGVLMETGDVPPDMTGGRINAGLWAVDGIYTFDPSLDRGETRFVSNVEYLFVLQSDGAARVSYRGSATESFSGTWTVDGIRLVITDTCGTTTGLEATFTADGDTMVWSTVNARWDLSRIASE